MNRRNCSVSSFIRVLHRGMEIIIITSRLSLGIRSSWVLSHRFFIRRMSHWRLTVGSGSLSPSSLYTSIMTMTRHHLQLNNSEVLHVRDGIITKLCSLLALGFLGMSSRKLSGHIISLKGLFEGNSMSSWL